MSQTATCKLASVLLQYPTAALFDGLGELDAFAATTSPRPAREAFARFLAWLRATPPAEVAQHYVQTFDLRRRCALYLTYYRYGDTRKRGLAMVAFKTAYRDAGFIPSEDELPDYLPMVLDFAALTAAGSGCCAPTAPTWSCCAAHWPRQNPPTRTSSPPSARSCPGWGGVNSPRCSPHGSPGRPARRSAWSRSRRRTT